MLFKFIKINVLLHFIQICIYLIYRVSPPKCYQREISSYVSVKIFGGHPVYINNHLLADKGDRKKLLIHLMVWSFVMGFGDRKNTMVLKDLSIKKSHGLLAFYCWTSYHFMQGRRGNFYFDIIQWLERYIFDFFLVRPFWSVWEIKWWGFSFSQ